MRVNFKKSILSLVLIFNLMLSACATPTQSNQQGKYNENMPAVLFEGAICTALGIGILTQLPHLIKN